jgi:hypothetical protein
MIFVHGNGRALLAGDVVRRRQRRPHRERLIEARRINPSSVSAAALDLAASASVQPLHHLPALMVEELPERSGRSTRQAGRERTEVVNPPGSCLKMKRLKRLERLKRLKRLKG